MPRPDFARYDVELLDAMGITPLAYESVPSGASLARVLLMPSFHRDVCITARDLGDVGEVELVIAPASSRDRALRAIGVRVSAPPDAPGSGVITARVTLDGEALAPLRVVLTAIDRDGLQAAPDLGLDGMPVRGELVDDRGALVFRAWSPSDARQPAAHRVSIALLTLAAAHLDDDVSQRALEQARAYIDGALPLRDLGGAPRRVRIYGRLTHPPHPDLVSFIEANLDDSPLLLDLGDFEGMGTALYPLLRRLDGRAGPTVWRVSPSARAYLTEAGIDGSRLFDALDDARAALVGLVEASSR